MSDLRYATLTGYYKFGYRCGIPLHRHGRWWSAWLCKAWRLLNDWIRYTVSLLEELTDK